MQEKYEAYGRLRSLKGGGVQIFRIQNWKKFKTVQYSWKCKLIMKCDHAQFVSNVQRSSKVILTEIYNVASFLAYVCSILIPWPNLHENIWLESQQIDANILNCSFTIKFISLAASLPFVSLTHFFSMSSKFR